MTSKEVSINLSEKTHSRALPLLIRKITRISSQSAKSINSENREKSSGLLLLSIKNTKFEFRSLLGLKSVLDELEYATLLTFQEAFEIYSVLY